MLDQLWPSIPFSFTHLGNVAAGSNLLGKLEVCLRRLVRFLYGFILDWLLVGCFATNLCITF